MVDVAEVWAGLTLATGREAQGANFPVAYQPAIWTIRSRTDLNTNMRIRFGSRYFAIRAISVAASDDQFMQLTCEEVK